VARRFITLAHDCCADHHAHHVKSDSGAVAVGVGDQARLQDPIVVAGLDSSAGALAHSYGVAQRIAGFKREQIMLQADGGYLAERVLKTQRQEEMLSRIRQLCGGIIRWTGRLKNASRWNPPLIITFTVDVTAIAGEHGVIHTWARNFADQAGSKRQFVGFKRRCE
jgi:hypothetical protein